MSRLPQCLDPYTLEAFVCYNFSQLGVVSDRLHACLGSSGMNSSLILRIGFDTSISSSHCSLLECASLIKGFVESFPVTLRLAP